MYFKYFVYICICIVCTVSDFIEFEIIFVFERCQCFQGIQVIIYLLFLDFIFVLMFGFFMGSFFYLVFQSGLFLFGVLLLYEFVGFVFGGLFYDLNFSKYLICFRFNCFSFYFLSRQVILCLSRILFEIILNSRL